MQTLADLLDEYKLRATKPMKYVYAQFGLTPKHASNVINGHIPLSFCTLIELILLFETLLERRIDEKTLYEYAQHQYNPKGSSLLIKQMFEARHGR